MSNLVTIAPGLYRIQVPFEAIYTTVYVVKYPTGVALIDSGDMGSDIDDYVLPALIQLGIHTKDVQYLLLTHDHGDHAGGIQRLSECFPDAAIKAPFHLSLPHFAPLTDGELLLNGLQVLFLPGHNAHSVGYFDVATKTLLSGDCLQLSGVDKYRGGVGEPSLYEKSIEKLLGMDILRIAAAHEYDPYGALAEGHMEVERYLRYCLAHK